MIHVFTAGGLKRVAAAGKQLHDGCLTAMSLCLMFPSTRMILQWGGGGWLHCCWQMIPAAAGLWCWSMKFSSSLMVHPEEPGSCSTSDPTGGRQWSGNRCQAGRLTTEATFIMIVPFQAHLEPSPDCSLSTSTSCISSLWIRLERCWTILKRRRDSFYRA